MGTSPVTSLVCHPGVRLRSRGEACGMVWNLLFSSPSGDSGIIVLRPPTGRGLATQRLSVSEGSPPLGHRSLGSCIALTTPMSCTFPAYRVGPPVPLQSPPHPSGFCHLPPPQKLSPR